MAGSGSVITAEFNALLTHFGGKVQKDRISALLCCNLDGSHKLRPLLIGKSKKPRGFPENFKTSKKFPADWAFSSKAWMTSSIFKSWLLKWNRALSKY